MTRDRYAVPLFLLIASVPAAASAGGHGTDVFAGYSFAHPDETNRHGANLAAAFDLGPISAFVDTSVHGHGESDVTLRDVTVMAGPGLRFGTRGRTVGFVRVLAGLVEDKATISVLDVDISEGSWGLGFLAGGGADFRVTRSLAVRLQGDYLLRDTGAEGIASCVPGATSCGSTGGWSSGYRVSAGLVYRFGIAP